MLHLSVIPEHWKVLIVLFSCFSVIRRLFWILLLHRSRFLNVISVGLAVVSNFLKNVLALLTTLSSLHFYWVTSLVFRVLNWYFIRGRRLSYLFSVFVCKKKELLIPVFLCFSINYNCSNRGWGHVFDTGGAWFISKVSPKYKRPWRVPK